MTAAWTVVLNRVRFNNIIDYDRLVFSNPVYMRHRPYLTLDAAEDTIVVNFRSQPTAQEQTVIRLLLGNLLI